MKVEGRTKYENLPKPIFKSKPLKEELVEKGEIFIFQVAKGEGVFSVSLLFIAPGSSLKKQKYDDCCVRYQVVDADDIEYCFLGKEHEVVNISDSCWLVVIAIKRYIIRA